jgi:hypothetical protein
LSSTLGKIDKIRNKSIHKALFLQRIKNDLPPMRQPDEGRRFPDVTFRRGPAHRAPEVDLLRGEAAALPCLRARCARGGRSSWPPGGVLDIAALTELIFQRDQEEEFSVRRGRSQRREKRNLLSFKRLFVQDYESQLARLKMLSDNALLRAAAKPEH